jgi:pimeloyl-ACP methyl ester carboxylesterase
MNAIGDNRGEEMKTFRHRRLEPMTRAPRASASVGAAERAPAPARSLTRFREGRGDPLLLVHGLGLSWRSWKPVLGILSREHDVVALDVPGFGAAPRLPHGRPTVAALTDAVEADLDRAELGRVHVAGNSLGGWIALELARRGRTASVVALSPSGLENPVERIAVMSMNEVLRVRTLAAAPAATLLTADPVSRSAMLGGLHGRPWRVPAGDAAAEIRDFANAPGFHATLHATTGSTAPTGLSDIRVPVRICFGTRDLMLGRLTAPRFAAAIPGAELVPLPGCGHVPMSDDPPLVARAITDLTRTSRVDRTGPPR